MDKKILVDLSLVDALKKVVTNYRNVERLFSLVMLIPVDPNAIESKYTLIISAPWLDNMSPKEAVDTILDDLVKEIGSSTSSTYQRLARITVIKSNDRFVQAINSAFSVSNSIGEIHNVTINGVTIERAIILESHRVGNTPQPTP